MLPALQTETGGLEIAARAILEVKAKPDTGDEVVAFFRSILPETRAHECKIWPHLTAVLNLSDRNSDFI